ASIFVYPSLAEKGETFGLAALEAMAAGCAPIVSNLACFQDFITHGESGLIFDHRTAEPVVALADGLRDLALAPPRLERMREQAWQQARHYRLPLVGAAYLEDFADVLSSEPLSS